MPAFHESVRPMRWDDVAGQDNAVKAVRRVLSRGWGGRAWWIIGASGTGKTTIAKLIAAEGAADLSTDELDAGSLTPAKLRELEHHYRVKPLPMDGKAGWALIVNECHKLRRDTVTALLDVLERVPNYVTWIFTTTRQGQASFFADDESGDTAPLVSRCVELELETGAEYLAAAAKRVKAVAMAEGLDGLPESVYLAALQGCRGNMRALLARVESGLLAREAKREMQRELAALFGKPGAESRREELQAALAAL